MSWPGLYALLALVSLAGVLLLYRQWEPAGRGRVLLGALRWMAAALVLLLLFNPVVPVRSADARRFHVLLDGSLSMGTPGDSGRTAWQEAVARAGDERVRDVVIFGGAPRATPLDDLGPTPPGATHSLLEPALRVVAEEGGRRVLVLSDGRITDAPDAERLARDAGLDVRLVRVGGDSVDYAVAEMHAPSWAESGKPLTVRIGVTSSDTPRADTMLAVILKEDGRVVARGAVAAPAPGRVASVALEVTPATGDRLSRLDAELEGGDAVPDDDRRVAYVRITSRPAIVLVSLHPDWEPRFLAPTLERALGLPVQGFLRVGATRYLRLGAGSEAGAPVSLAAVRRAVAAADLLVVHGMDDGAPDWVGHAVRRARRLLLLPDTGAYSASPVPLSAPAGGEWYLSDDLPASPVASLLSDLDVENLPPLSGPRLLRLPRRWWTPLVLRRGRHGVDVPMLAAGDVNGRRIVVATAGGTWRWAFTGGNPATYDRVWSAVAGWLMGRERTVEAASVLPAQRVAERGSALQWLAPGLKADSVALAIQPAVGTAVDTVVAFVNDTATTDVLGPGDYTYRARAFRRDSIVATASGPFSVASFSRDFTAPVVSFRWEGASPLAGRGSRMPLRAMAWPYLLLLLVLTVEWTLRRRWGLR